MTEAQTSAPTQRPRLHAATLRRVERAAGGLSTGALNRMQQSLPWFAAMPPQQRSFVGLVLQAAIADFVGHLRSAATSPQLASGVFATAPPEMARLVTLQQTVELIRTAVGAIEDAIADLAAPGDEALLREAVLRYSREVAFAAAEVYAHAAEQRGAWDARLEALVVDAVLWGEPDEALLSRAAALGWSNPPTVAVLAGRAPEGDPQQVIEDVHRRTHGSAVDVLAGVQGSRLVTLLGTARRLPKAAQMLAVVYGEGPVVLGPTVASLSAARASATAAFAGLRVAHAWPEAPRPVDATALLPERALDGDVDARRRLIEDVYRPLVAAGGALLETADAYSECGGSLEATARRLYVHPNTVRYRLRRVTDVCGLAPSTPRDHYVIRIALSVGRLIEPL